MEDYESTVEQQDTSTADDALNEEVVEEQAEEPAESLESIMDEGGEQPAEEPQDTGKQGTSEPGWIKKRVDKAVQRAVAETEARMNAYFEQQMAPIRERMITAEANELVQKGIVKDIETAKELVRYRQNMGAASTEPSTGSDQPRNDKGQYASKGDPATSARIDMLQHQADRIRAAGGPDVIAEFRNNEEIKQKVISGELDFYDVAEDMKSRKPSRKPPSPMRSPNGASGTNPNAIDSMSDEQFERMEKRIKEGARYTLK